jgi:hypothetical protein
MNSELHEPLNLKDFYENRRGFLEPVSSSGVSVKRWRENGNQYVRFTKKLDEDQPRLRKSDSITFKVSGGRVVGINIRIPGRVESWIINFNSDGSCEYRYGDRTVNINEFNEATCDSMGKWSRTLETIARNSDRRRKISFGIVAGALLTLTKSSSPLAPAVIQPSAEVEEEVSEPVSTTSIGNKPVDQTRETARRTIGDVLGKEYFEKVAEYKRRYPYNQSSFEKWLNMRQVLYHMF